MKKLLVALAGVIAAAMGLVGVGTASAAPVPQVSPTGYNFGTFGDHASCRGAINVTVDAPAKKRGVVRVTARSHGFTGDGAGWKRNPKCRVLFGNFFTSVRGYNLEKWVSGTFGPRPGEKKVWEIATGSGPVSLGFGGFSPNTQVRVPAGYGATIYMLVP
ncbi:enoyl-CoA hydratase [Gordonia rubripertincta]|uniref:enoyl-CoA hydratase n=1 Tax=Gordonia rubripertincta TaxID=36822 RepID=UPI0015F93956|nr:enoyl-CoA hydratase [Gordonia rubripertincta]QMU22262.1 enoyl-CoA hydratase [Gordonia rubripertincta]